MHAQHRRLSEKQYHICVRRKLIRSTTTMPDQHHHKDHVLLPVLVLGLCHGLWQRASAWLRISIAEDRDGCLKAASISFISAQLDTLPLWRPRIWTPIVVHWRRRGTLQGKRTEGTRCVQEAAERRNTEDCYASVLYFEGKEVEWDQDHSNLQSCLTH